MNKPHDNISIDDNPFIVRVSPEEISVTQQKNLYTYKEPLRIYGIDEILNVFLYAAYVCLFINRNSGHRIEAKYIHPITRICIVFLLISLIILTIAAFIATLIFIIAKNI
jgi:hypothetical protein